MEDEDYKESEISKKVKELMDDGYEFGEAVREALKEGFADGGSIGIEVLFKPKRQNLFMGGPALTGPALNIYNSMKAYDSFTDQEIADAIKQAGYSLPTADSGTTTPPSSAAPDTSNQSGGGFDPYTPNPTETRTKDDYSPYAARKSYARPDSDVGIPSGILSNSEFLYGKKSPLDPLMAIMPGQQLIKAVGSILPTNKRAIVENELLGKGFAIDDVGRFVAATPGSINTAENIMAGYNAYQVDAETFAKRRETINKYMKDPVQKAAKLKALAEAEAKILGANTTAKNIIDEKDGTTTTPKTLSEKIIAGITAAEDDKGSDMLEDIETITNKDIDTSLPKKKPTTFPDYSGVTGVIKPGTKSTGPVTGTTKPGTGIETIKTGQLTKEQYEQMADLISKTNATVYNETTGKYEDIFGNEIKNPNAIDNATLVGTTKTKSPITGTTKPGTGGRGPVTGTTKPGTKSKGTTTGTTKPGTKSKSKSITDRGRGQSNVGTKSKGPVSTKGQAGPPSQRGGGGSRSKGPVSTRGQAGPPSQRGGGGGGGGGGCFLKGTLITMLDGTRKPVEQVDLGNKVAIGGKVFATGKFLVENLHDYKGIKVSGSHMVNEDNKWVRVEDSKHGKPLGDDEHTVYVFGSENRRILINGILFTDYFETKEQEKLIDDEKDFFDNWKSYDKKIDLDNINTLNAN